MPLIFALATRAIQLVQLLIVAWALMSWFNPDPRNPIVKFIHAVVDPFMRPISALIPPIGGIDLSPLVALLLLQFIERIFMGAALGASLR
jgi:YggT family protein